MSIINLAVAKEHLRVNGTTEDLTIQLYINAAEKSAASFLNRRVFVDAVGLDAAKVQARLDISAASAAYDAAIISANLLTNATQKQVLITAAIDDYAQTQDDAIQALRGIVANDAIKAAMLLTIGHLYENREQEFVGATISKLEMGVHQILMPYRVGMGV